MATAEQVDVDVRALTDAEIADYKENGWTTIRGFISPETARALLDDLKAVMGEQGDTGTNIREGDRNRTAFAKWYSMDEESRLFRGLRLNRQLGRNSALLMGRDMPVRSLTNLAAVKLPHDASAKDGKGLTDWHQDQGSTPVKATTMAFWIALDEITPEMGSMVFHNGSHRAGILAPPIEDWGELLEDYPLSEPLHLQPGDATAHSSLVVHGAGLNMGDRPRWGYIINTFPGNAPYIPYPTRHTAGIEDALTPGKPLDHPRFPLIYTPEG
jgi:ectoine hydroxylase-related dioxygenase (phytanoyl-CoA dioxygenase family)